MCQSIRVKPLLEQFEALQQQIDQERNQHRASSYGERSPSSNSRAASEAYSEEIAQLESEKQTVWQAIRKHDPVLAGQIQVEALTFEQIQNLIDQPTTAILSIFTTSTDTYIFVVRHNQLTLHTCSEEGTETFQNWIVENWSKPYVEDTDQWENQLSSVLATLAQRLQIRELIEQHLQGIEELIIVPHLFLHQIPFAALPIDEREYLGDRFLIRHSPSCQILQFCQNRPATPEPLVYGIVENATDDLPCAGFEGVQVSELLGISDEHRLKGSKQATVENFRNLAKAVNVLHCSHHAGSRLDNPLHSELLLANGSITLGQLLTPGWRLPQLSDVFLSCCETHLGAPTVTDDILTLATGFLCAGSRSVISTLWLVDDLATALFSIFYYEQRHQGCDRPMSLQNAQSQLRCLNREHLNELFNQTDTRRQQFRQNRDLHPVHSATYQALNGEYESYANVAIQLYKLKNSNKEFPFSPSFYWAGFICQGLR